MEIEEKKVVFHTNNKKYQTYHVGVFYYFEQFRSVWKSAEPAKTVAYFEFETTKILKIRQEIKLHSSFI